MKKRPIKRRYSVEETYNFIDPTDRSHPLSYHYGVATVSRLLQIVRLFCRISSLLTGSFEKETYNFKEPTNRSHPIRLSDASHHHSASDDNVAGHYYATITLRCELLSLGAKVLADYHIAIMWRGGGLGSRPKKMYGERLRDGVEYHLMSPTPRRKW